MSIKNSSKWPQCAKSQVEILKLALKMMLGGAKVPEIVFPLEISVKPLMSFSIEG